MSDEELSAADEARIRSLLAAAKHDEPMPEAVVARLDRVLAGLAEDGLEPAPAEVVRLADRRRRAATMLVAAAAVVLAGFGISQLVSHRGSGALTSGDAGTDRSLSGSAPEAGEKSESGFAGSGGAMPNAPQPLNPRGDSAYKVRPRYFAADSRRIQTQSRAMMDSLRNDAASADGRAAYCPRGHWGDGRYIPVDYGRAPAYLVLRKASGDSQVADLFLCQGTEPVRSITLPDP